MKKESVKKTSMKKFIMLPYTSCDAIKEKLEQLALQGWELVAMAGTMHIFVSIHEEDIPIQTDESIKLDAINKSMIKSKWIVWWMMPALFFVQLCSYLLNLDLLLTSNMMISVAIMYITMIIVFLVDCIRYLVWKKRNRIRIKNGEKIKHFGK